MGALLFGYFQNQTVFSLTEHVLCGALMHLSGIREEYDLNVMCSLAAAGQTEDPVLL